MDYDSALVTIAVPADEDSGRIELPVLLPKTPRCPKREPDEIVVCAQDPESFRLRPLPKNIEPPVPPARLKLGESASVGAELESAGVGGHVSNRVMIRGRIKF